MDICIVTVYNSINSGSFWQAYALGRALQKMGHQVFYYESPTAYSPSSPFVQKKILIKTFIKCGMNEAIRYSKSIAEFKKIQSEKFNIIQDKELKNMDFIVVGSDTVWNVKDKYFYKWRHLFCGIIFKGKKILSYAASSGNSCFEMTDKDICESLSKFNYLSVRDEHTQNEVKKLTQRKAVLVCDPTLLLDKNDIIYNYPDRLNLEKPYIFVYLFQALSEWQKEELLKYAKKNDYRIVSTLRKEKAPYTDELIINTPMNFCECMRNAKIVITDTYHGTIFPLLFRKQFVTVNRNKVTVNSILYQLNLEERLATDDNIREVLNSKIDYEGIEQELNSLRRKSYNFLIESLKV